MPARASFCNFPLMAAVSDKRRYWLLSSLGYFLRFAISSSSSDAALIGAQHLAWLGCAPDFRQVWAAVDWALYSMPADCWRANTQIRPFLADWLMCSCAPNKSAAWLPPQLPVAYSRADRELIDTDKLLMQAAGQFLYVLLTWRSMRFADQLGEIIFALMASMAAAYARRAAFIVNSAMAHLACRLMRAQAPACSRDARRSRAPKTFDDDNGCRMGLAPCPSARCAGQRFGREMHARIEGRAAHSHRRIARDIAGI